MRLSEAEILERFSDLYDGSKPLSISITRNRKIKKLYERYDVIAELMVENNCACYVAIEVINVPNPKNLQNKTILIKQKEKESSTPINVIIVTPYIGPKQRKILDKQKLSWIDLCGNMKIEIPERVYIEKTGNDNIYPDSEPIKYIYTGGSSLICKALLLKPEGFESQYKITDYIIKNNGETTNSTVSRVLKKLSDELLITKENKIIRAKDPEQILNNLQENRLSWEYIASSYRYGVKDQRKLINTLRKNQIEYAFCGFYAASLKGIAVTDEIDIVIKNLKELKNLIKNNNIELESDSEYGNVQIFTTDAKLVWFNVEEKRGNIIVDDIELYLELINDKPRGPKIAGTLKEEILKGFKK